MLELAALPLMIAASGVQPATPMEVPSPHWASKHPAMLKYLLESLVVVRRDPNELHAFGTITYTEKGPLGIPTLTISAPDFEYRGQPDAHPFGATQACFMLDLLAKQAGAWGPECRIKKFLELPKKGALSKSPYPDLADYQYSIRKVGKDRVRYILENGTGREVDVTCNIRNVKFVPTQDGR